MTDRGIPFTKLVGTGNDFVLVDARHRGAVNWSRLARTLCDPKRGEGTDGLLVLGPSRRADIRMRIFNPDGSEPAMCGNGIRCLAWYAHRAGAVPSTMTIETGSGIKRARIQSPRRVRVNMGAPVFRRRLERFFRYAGRPVDADLVDSGVPHLVCWMPNVSRLDVDGLGRRLRRDARLGRGGANVDFVQITHARGATAILKMRTYERGVEGETQACGTGAVAAAAACVRRALLERPSHTRYRFSLAVRVPGGTLQVELTAHRGRGTRAVFGPAFLEGRVQPISTGVYTSNGRSLQ